MSLKYCPESWVNCKGNAVTGDYVRFTKAIFSGNYPNSKFSHLEEFEGEIIKDSYGLQSHQHTFTILLISGEKMLIKGRNLYANEIVRLLWNDETLRDEALSNKYQRKKANRFDAYKQFGL